MAKKRFLDGYETYDTTRGLGSAKKWRSAFYDRIDKKEAARILKNTEQSPYELLELSLGASKEEIKKAYRKMLMQWHPDLNQHRIEEAEQMTKKIIAAYSLISE